MTLLCCYRKKLSLLSGMYMPLEILSYLINFSKMCLRFKALNDYRCPATGITVLSDHDLFFYAGFECVNMRYYSYELILI